VADGGPPSRQETRLALAIVSGIGLHNLSEGLAIGQSAATGRTALAAGLVIGFALHNSTEGFGIVGPLVTGETRVPWRTTATTSTTSTSAPARPPTCSLKLPRSCGHLIAWDDVSREEFTSADVTSAVSAGVPAADGGAGAGRPGARGARGGVRAGRPIDPELDDVSRRR
jgi:ZIP Zinc transporter